jgi:zinc protease
MRIPAVLTLAAILLAASVAAGPSDIPARPEALEFPPLEFEVPDAQGMRVELANGVPVYIAEDRQFPLTTIQIFFRGGEYLDPPEKAGLAQITGRVWRTGGAGDLDGRALDEELDFLAARLATSIGNTQGSVTLNVLSKDLDRGLEILMDVLLRPRFDADRLAVAKEDLLAAMRERNDSTAGIEAREWNRLIYGDDYWINRLATRPSVESIERDDLVRFQNRLLHPSDLVLAVAGDFDREEMVARLNLTVGTIRDRGEPAPEIPQPTHRRPAGVYLVNKSDVNQGRVSIGHLGLLRPVEDEFALGVAMDVFGGGGFTSWMLQRVRVEEGLAYSAGSTYGIGNAIPGTFRAFFQSKSSSCARAAQLSLELMERVRSRAISEEELRTSKNSFIQTFPNRFGSALQTANLYAQDALVGRPHDYWVTYRDEVERVSGEAALEAARRYIRPDELVVLVVGNVEEILQGDPDHPEARFERFGELVRVPLRDPMTLRPLSE